MVWSYFFFLIWIAYLIASSILLFTRGFLLTRESFDFNSTCLNRVETQCTTPNSLHTEIKTFDEKNHSCSDAEFLDSVVANIHSSSLFCLPARARVVLIIIDALRYDFTIFNPKNKRPLPYQNRLPIIHETLKFSPDKSRLFKFIADPPTTTMQRLKALTTGSLPTFIDAGSNFASSEIKEDNIIDQLIRNHKSAIFMGDDTWDALYPGRFKRNYPFPSFDVKDLDTVDRGVTDNIYHELKRKDWSLLIGHFLGVDHAGHRYGPNHSEMKRKLEEMNIAIEKIMNNLGDDMILYVLGDHGMTVTGDHGGETENEVGSALYIFSKIPFASPQNIEITKQVNIVPTLATALGISIPFPNLGSILHEALPILNHSSIPQWKFSLLSTWTNVEQVVEYVRQYSKSSEIFEESKLENIFEKYYELKKNILSIDNEDSFEDFHSKCVQLITEIRNMCEEIWIQFDSFSITRGLLLLFLTLFFMFIIVDGVPANYLQELFVSSFLMCSYIVCIVAACISTILYHFDIVSSLESSIFFSTGVISQFMLAMLIVQNWDTISLTWHSKAKYNKLVSFTGRLVLAFTLISLFSNSYIEEESTCLLFLLTTFCFLGLMIFSKNVAKEKHCSKWVKYKFVLFSIVVIFLLRLSVHFWKCREEQGSCFVRNSAVSKVSTKSEWAVTLASLVVFVTITKTWLKNCGSLNDYSLSVTLAKYAPTVMVVCTGGYWVLHRFPIDSRHRTNLTWKVDHLAWVVYATSLIGIISTILQPLLIYILPRKSNLPVWNESNIIPQLFKNMKVLIEDKEKAKNEIPIIYGLGTIYSTAFIAIAVYLTILIGLILGDTTAPSAVIMFLTAMFLLIVMSLLRIDEATSINELFEVPNISILIWVITCHYFFYATGHQPAWSNIDWNAAFIGTSGILSNKLIQGTLMIINIFCPYIILGFLLPMLVIAPFTLFIMMPSVLSGNKDLSKDILSQGELFLFEKNENMFASVFVISCKYLACHGIRVFGTMLASTIHCRHLMVWKLFAPKFIFEGVAMFVTLTSVIIGYLVLVRTNLLLEKLIDKLNRHKS